MAAAPGPSRTWVDCQCPAVWGLCFWAGLGPRSRETKERLMLKGHELYPRNLGGIIVIIVRGNRDRWTNVASAGIVGEL